MIVSHVWDYSFDTGTNAVDVLVHRLRDKIDKRLRAQAPPHRARRRLCPQGGVTRFRHALTLRLGLWYAGAVRGQRRRAAARHLRAARPGAGRPGSRRAGVDAARATPATTSAAGLPGLQPLVDADASEGRHERLLVRVVERQRRDRLLRAAAGVERLRPVRPRRARRRSDSAGRPSPTPPIGSRARGRHAPTWRDGVIVQVGRSSHVRDELLRPFPRPRLRGRRSSSP